MTIAEFFVRIGIKVDGGPQFDKAVKDLGLANLQAINLKHAILALGASFTALMYYAASAGTTLYKFGVSTGLSTARLQQWQRMGAKSGVAANEVTAAVEAIQDAQTQIAWGQGNLAPWSLLGIDTRENPFDVLWKLHEAVKESAGMAAGTARYLASGFGIGPNVFQMLRRDDLRHEDLIPKSQLISEEDQRKADQLNGKILQLKQTLASFAVEFGARISDPVVRLLDKLGEKGGVVDHLSDWLNRLAENSKEGQAARDSLKAWAKGILELAGAVATLNVASKAAGTIGAAGTILGFLLGAGRALVAGKGVGGRIGVPVAIAAAITAFIGYEILKHGKAKQTGAADPAKEGWWSSAIGELTRLLSSPAEGSAVSPSPGAPGPIPVGPAGGGGYGNVKFDVNITNEINGAQNPAAVGREVGRASEAGVNRAATKFVDMTGIGVLAH